MNKHATATQTKADPRRAILLVLALGAITTGLAFSFVEGLESGRAFAAASTFRIGIVLFALWLALPTLRKPMSWLPPGMAALCLLAIMAIAAQPRLIIIIAPGVTALLALGWFARGFRTGTRR